MADLLPPPPIDAPFGAYGWNDWYRKVRDAINSGQDIPFAQITGLPTTVQGYGITNALYVASNAVRWDGTVANLDPAFLSGPVSFSTPGGSAPTRWKRVRDDNGDICYIPIWKWPP
jgi:hypothetical protein